MKRPVSKTQYLAGDSRHSHKQNSVNREGLEALYHTFSTVKGWTYLSQSIGPLH